MEKAHPLLLNNCENCGIVDDLEYFEFVHQGITLCSDCADLKVSEVSKRNAINWVKINGELFPTTYAKKKSKHE